MATVETIRGTWAVTVRWEDGRTTDYTVEAATCREATRLALARWHRDAQHLITQLLVGR